MEANHLSIFTSRACLHLALFALGTEFHWAALSTVILPTDLLRLVPESEKARVVGLLASGGAVIAVIGEPLFGAWSDRTLPRWGRRPFIIAGTVLELVAVLGMARAPNLTVFALSFLLSSAVLSMAVAAYHGLWRDLVPAGKEGIFSGYVGLMTVIGILLGLAVSGVTVGTGHIRLAYLAIGGVVLAAAAATVGRFGWKQIGQGQGQPPSPAARSHVALWRYPWVHRDFTLVFFHRILVMFGFNMVTVFLEYYLKDVLKRPDFAAATSLLGVVVMVGAIISSVKAGTLSDRWGRKGLVIWGGVIMAAAVLAMPAVHSFVVVLALGLTFGLGYGIFSAVDLALGMDVLPSSALAARDLGIWNMSYYAGRMVAPLTGWQILDRIDPGGTGGYTILFLCAAAAFVGGSLLVFRVRGVR